MRALLLVCILVSASATAAESGVYESMADVTIGRVFLTPDQRRMLDEARERPPAASTIPATGQGNAVQAEARAAAAGYIISSSGKSRQWRDGEFIEARGSSPEAMRFPGDVRIIRHRPASSDDQPGSGEAVEAEPEAPGDATDEQ